MSLPPSSGLGGSSVGAGHSASLTPASSTNKSRTVNAGTSLSPSKLYFSGSYGTEDFKPDCGCLEARAYDAGGAVACDFPEKACHPVQGITFYAGDNFGTLKGLADNTNMNFHCTSRLASVSTNLNLNGPVYV